MPWSSAPLTGGARAVPQASTSGRPALAPWPHVLQRGPGSMHVAARAARIAKSSSERGRKARRTPSPVPALCTMAGDEEILRLNVGGTMVHTARSTLLQLPGSVLHDMFRRENAHLLTRSCDGTIFLDMDPLAFQQVLRFMREVKMRGGLPDASLSSFPEEDRPHLALLLQHLGVIDATDPDQEQPQHKSSKPLPTPLPDQVPGRKKKKQAKAAESEHQQVSCDREGTTRAAQPSPVACQGDGTSANSQASAPVRPQKGVQQQRGSAEGGSSPANSLGSGKPHQPISLHTSSTARSSVTSSSALDSEPALSPSLSHLSSAPAQLSQMYFIQAQRDARRGMKISVYTEGDLASIAPSERFEVFCNASASSTELSLTFVSRQDFDDTFLGVTTREHIDRKGSVVPCFGWKANSRTCPTVQGEGGQQGSAHCLASQSALTCTQQGQKANLPLWGKGDSVELIVSLPPNVAGSTGVRSGAGSSLGASAFTPTMVLKVNGKELERLSNLPPLRDWCWYIALELGGDMSCVSLMEDSYAVHWAEYQVKRFLS